MLLMRRLSYLIVLIVGFMVIGQILSRSPDQHPQVVEAQSDDGAAACDTLIQDALAEVANTCLNIGRNEICYGHSRVSATLTDDTLFFEQPGDIVPVSALDSVVTRSANPDTGEWGIALMDVQTDLPNGEDTVRMVMFGGLEVVPATDVLVSDNSTTCDIVNTTGENINLRAGAGLNNRVVDILDNNDSLQIYGQSEDGTWLRSNRGWISSTVVTPENCSGDLPTFVAQEDAYTAPMQAFTLQVNDAALCEATPPGMLIQVPDGQTANIMVNNVELRVGSTAFVTIVDNDDMEDDEDDQSLLVANLDGNVFATGNGSSQHIFPGSQSYTPLNTNGTPSGGPQGIVPFSQEVQSLNNGLLSTAFDNNVTVPDPLSFTPSSTDESGSGSVSVPLGEWGACGTCSTCVGPSHECRVDPSGACVWDAADCGGIGVGPSVSCTGFCGGSATFPMGSGSSFDVIFTPGGSEILSGVSSNSGGLLYATSGETYVSDTQYTVDFFCYSPGGPGTFSVDIYDSLGNFYQISFTLTCT